MIRPKRLELPWQEPQALAHQLAHAYGEEGLVWLDGDGSNLGRWATLAVAPQRSSAAAVSLENQEPAIPSRHCGGLPRGIGAAD